VRRAVERGALSQARAVYYDVSPGDIAHASVSAFIDAQAVAVIIAKLLEQHILRGVATSYLAR